jgi:hypothetical protein
MEEVWKDVVGYEGLYQVSNIGRIKSVKRYANSKSNKLRSVPEKIIKSKINKHGYECVQLHDDGARKHITVHRVVALAFITNSCGKPQINHIDGIKTNNSVTNMEWCTNSENMIHAHKLGLVQMPLGEKHYMSKAITQYNKDGEYIKNYKCMSDAQRELGIDTSCITRCCKGKYQTAGGFIWRYSVN